MQRYMNTATSKIQNISKKKFLVPSIYAVLVIILCMIPYTNVSGYYLHILIMTFLYIVAVSSLRLIIISGQMPLAHGAFMGIGAYASAIIAIYLHLTPWLSIFLGGFISACIGMFIGYPFARLRAMYYALGSLFFGEGIIQVILALDKVTNGYHGLTGIPGLLPTMEKTPYFYLYLVFMIVCLIAIYRFEHSRIGINLKAIAQSHTVASSVGIDEAKYRILVLTVGCFFAGLTGAAYAHYSQALSYTNFNLTATLWLYIYAWIGGIGSFAGPLIGTSLLMIAPELLRGLQQYVPYISAIILLAVVYLMPKGLAGLPELVRNLISDREKVKKPVIDTSKS
jgi:branched-chain amino acid transport system permease protein